MTLALRSGLITPGSVESMLRKAAASAADVIHIELEDGIPPDQKQQARDVAAKALTELDWSGKITLPRVNDVESGWLEDDVDAMVPARPTALVLAKCNGPEDIHYLNGLISAAERRHGVEPGTVKIVSMIERIRALQLASEIATASPRMYGLYIGPSDLANEVGYRREYHGLELETMFVRSQVVIAAHGAGLIAIDSSYVPFRDLEGTYEQSRWCYRLGFDAKVCIHPTQIDAVNRAFTPDDEEVSWAEEVLAGQKKAEAEGHGVWVAKGMMMDAPHVIRARRILAAAGRQA